MARSYDANFFFTVSLKGILGFFIIRLLGEPSNGVLPTMVKYCLATLIGSAIFNPVLVNTLKSYLGVLRVRPSYTNCCVVASIIKVIYDSLFKKDDMISLKILPLISMCILSAVSLVWDRDYTGITEGILIASGKWFIINCMALKWEKSVVCGVVLSYSILALFTSVGEPLRDRTDDATPLKQNVYFTGEPHEERQKNALVLRFFRLCFFAIKYTGGMATIWLAHTLFLGYTTSPVLLSLGVVSSIASFIGGISLFKEVLTEFVKCQQSKEERRWFIAVGIMGVCEAVLDEHKIVSLIIISAISIFTICIIVNGWDHDRSGVTDGLLMTYFQWTTLFLVTSKSSLQWVVCGLTLSFVVASKFTEPLEKQS